MLADSSIVHATQQGEIKICFTSEQGKQCKLKLLRVLYIPVLNRRLFSIPAFVRDSKFNVTFLSNLTRFQFGDGTTFIIPVNRLVNISMEASHTVEEEELHIKTSLPTMTVEKGHKILSHRSIRSLLSGSINEVWADYRFIASPDEYCENFKIEAIKVQARSKNNAITTRYIQVPIYGHNPSSISRRN